MTLFANSDQEVGWTEVEFDKASDILFANPYQVIGLTEFGISV